MNKLKNNCLKSLVILGLAAMANPLQAQDAHLSEFDASPVLLNPALTGMFDDGDIRVAVNYRSQWGVLSSKFVTTGVGFDMPLYDRWGVGGYVYNSDFADVYSSFNFMLSGAYQVTKPEQEKMVLSTGIQVGFIYKRANDNKLIFDNQYDDGNFDSDLPTGESFEQYRRFMPDINIGFHYLSKNKDWKANPYGGFAVAHITTPDESFIGDQVSELPVRWTVSGGAKIELSDDIMLNPSLLFMRQRTFQEINIGTMASYTLKNTNYDILGGLFYRFDDAVIIHAGMKHLNNIYRISYDINTSSLSEYSNKRGAIEFSVLYTGKKKPKSATFIDP